MDGLKALRALFASLVAAPLLILVVLVIVMDDLGAPSPSEALAAVAAAAAGLVGSRWADRRPLPAGADDAGVAAAYRTSFFLSFALAEAGLLITFVLSFLVGGVWPYLIGLAAFLLAMALLAPTDRNLARRQEELMHAGSTVDLKDALRTSTSA